MPAIESLSLVTICVDGVSLSTLKQLGSTTGIVEIAGSFQHYFADPGESLPFEAPNICVIDFDKDWDTAALTADRVHKAFGQTSIFAVSQKPESHQVIRAMRCGCREYLVKPLDPDVLLEALVPAWRRKREKTVEERPAGQVMGFVGAKGGCGVTTLTTHLGALLARVKSRKTLLIDHHPQLGDAAYYLAVENPKYHFADLVQSTRERLDVDYLQAFLAHHPSGLDVLPSPDGSEPGSTVSAQAVEYTLGFLKSQYDLVLVDCPPGLGERNMALLNHCDQINVVTVPEIPALRNVTRYLAHLEKHRQPAERVRLILNRHATRGNITDAAIERAVEMPIHWKVPNDYGDVSTAINTGTADALPSHSAFMRNLIHWADAILADRAAVPAQVSEASAKQQPLPTGLRLTAVGGS
ncbi:MAG TPA: AAA family ATPase [Terriglobia bacterium]|nr:AAA family ATPase [Terriglobia bacterium]